MKYAVIALLMVLTACSTDHGEAYPTCIPLRTWTDIEQNNLKADMEALAPDSELIPAMLDYYRMRSQSRACSEVR